MAVLLDTSVVAKWIAEEAQTDMALTYRGQPVIAPDLLRAELAHALYKKVRRRELSALDALSGLTEAEELIVFVPSMHLSSRALELSLELNHAAGDCFFLALAEVVQQQLVTADLKFVHACRDTRYAALVRLL